MSKQPKYLSSRYSIGEEQAIALYESGWWQDCTAREVALFQLSTVELCLPFSEFHRCVEEVLNRPVFMHEFAMSNLLAELLGIKPAPTREEIIGLLPADKMVVVVMDAGPKKANA